MPRWSKPGPDLQPRPVICSRCGQVGGTLHKVELGKYEHDQCPVARRVVRLVRR